MVVREEADPGSPLLERGQNITADYWLYRVNGTLIESTEEDGPFTFVLGTGHGEAGRGRAAAPRSAQRWCRTPRDPCRLPRPLTRWAAPLPA